MHYVKERVDKICEELSKLCVRLKHPVSGWQMKRGFYVTPAQAEQDSSSWQPFDSATDFWEGLDQYYWFKTTLTVPQELSGQALWLHIMPPQAGWDAITPQLLIFVNGQPVQGGDVNHREVRLSEKAQAGESYTVELQAYTSREPISDHGQSHRLELHAYLFTFDRELQSLYYNLLVPNQILGRLNSQSPDRIRLERVLTQAVNLLDLRKPYSEEFAASVRAANAFIQTELYEKPDGSSEAIATCIGHTHIDVAWLWTVEQTRQKAARSFSTVLQLMEEYPEYKFMSSQPQLYQFVKERYPELYCAIREKIRQGRWEPEGGMWLEADCNVTSGESLVRQLLHGKRFFREEFGVDNRILWLPDVFGYSAALPQIMKKSGIDYFMTTKIAWNQFNQHPYDTFWWKGIDGSQVFTHLITTQNADQPEDSFFTTYNGVLDGVSVMRTWERYQQKELNNDVLIAFGYGDGGGGTTREMLENLERLSKGLPGAPRVRVATARQYFDELYARLHEDPRLPKWVGELYLEYHRGTYTSMARNKKANRKCELFYQDAEFFSVWAERYGAPYPAQQMDQAWKTILLNQFHDILPGTSIKEVYDTTQTEYEKLLSDAQALIQSRLGVLTGQLTRRAGDVAVFNSLSFERTDLIELDTTAAGYADDAGDMAKTQRTHDGKTLVLAETVPAKGAKVYTPADNGAETQNPFIISEKSIETGDYVIQFDDAYHMTSLFDKKNQREVLKAGAKGNVLIAYEDKPMNYDNWDIDIYYTEKSWIVDNVQSAQWLEHGPLRSVLSIKRRFVDSLIEQRICFYAHTPRIDFDTFVDWKQHQVLLKVDFPVDINANEATYDIQFGNITRPTHTNTSWEQAKFEVCAHKWADLSEDGYGVSLMNDCKYGYSIHEGSMKLTLLTSGIHPNPASDQEQHTFIYSLYPHQGDWKQAQTARQAHCLNVPLYAFARAEDAAAPCEKAQDCLLSIQGDNVMVETIKKAEDGNGTILRLHEYTNRRAEIALVWHGAAARVVECDLMENELAEIPCENGHFTAQIKPYEIKTFRIYA